MRLIILWSVILVGAVDISKLPHSYRRTNYGIMFHRVDNILNGITKYRHTFKVPIPDFTYTPLQEMPCITDRQRQIGCESVNRLTQEENLAVQKSFEQAKRHLDLGLKAIPNVEDMKLPASSWRLQRDLMLGPEYCKHMVHKQSNDGGDFLGLAGKVVSDIFGSPTWDDITVTANHICESAKVAEINKKAITSASDDLTSISETIEKHIDTVQRGMSDINMRLTETNGKLQELADVQVNDTNVIIERQNLAEVAQQVMFEIMTNLAHHKAQGMEHVMAFNDWLPGINQLLKGYVPENFVMIDDIQTVINYINNQIVPAYNHRLKLVHPNPGFYHQVRSISYTRDNNNIYITVVFPMYTAGGLLAVYRIDRTHISTTDRHESSTRIANLPDFIAVTADLRYYMELNLAHYMSCRGDDVRMCSSERSLQIAGKRTCAAALFYDHRDDIMARCDIHYEPYDLPSEAVLLDDASYLVHSKNAGPHNTWTMDCPYSLSGDRDVQQIPSCKTCIIEVPCGCSVEAPDFFIPYRLTGCKMTEHDARPTLVRTFPANLALLTHLYSPAQLTAWTGSNATSAPWLLDGLNLTVIDTVMPQVVEADKQYAGDFKKLLKLHNNKSDVYASKSEYFIKKTADMRDLDMASIIDLEERLDVHTWGAFFNPKATLGGVSTSVIISMAALIMASVNCYYASKRS